MLDCFEDKRLKVLSTHQEVDYLLPFRFLRQPVLASFVVGDLNGCRNDLFQAVACLDFNASDVASLAVTFRIKITRMKI